MTPITSPLEKGKDSHHGQEAETEEEAPTQAAEGRARMNLGWKTITGTILLAVGQALETLPEPLPLIGRILSFVGTLLAGIGLRVAIAKGGTK